VKRKIERRDYGSSVPQLIHIFFDCISNHAKL